MNRDQDRRDNLMVGTFYSNEYTGGIKRFGGLNIDLLNTLINEGFADLNDRQNDAPTLGQFREFMKSNSDFTAHGYVVSSDRSDYRLTIEGLKLNRRGTAEEMIEFTKLNKGADDFIIDRDRMFSWFD